MVAREGYNLSLSRIIAESGLLPQKNRSVATLQSPRDRLERCFPWPLRFAVCSRRQFEPEVILLAVGWYRVFLVVLGREELLAERGCTPITSRCGVGSSGMHQRWNAVCDRGLRPTNDSWRVDETYIRVKGKWVYLYRAVDSSGASIDFLLSAKRDQQRPGAFWPRPWAERTIRRRGSLTPTSTPVIRQPSCGSKPRMLWRRIAY